MAHQETFGIALVGVAQGTLSGIHNISNSQILVNTTHHQDIVQADFVLLGLVDVLVKSIVLSESGGVLLLPQPPETIDLRVVQEEKRLYYMSIAELIAYESH